MKKVKCKNGELRKNKEVAVTAESEATIRSFKILMAPEDHHPLSNRTSQFRETPMPESAPMLTLLTAASLWTAA